METSNKELKQSIKDRIDNLSLAMLIGHYRVVLTQLGQDHAETVYTKQAINSIVTAPVLNV